MIYNFQLNSLTEDEVCLLLFIFNELVKHNWQLEKKDLCFLKKEAIIGYLDSVVDKLKDEYKDLVKSIKNKIK